MQLSGSAPIITLTTDFGLVDHYVGTMKGVILSRCPGARLVDISHEIAPFSLYSGAYTIGQAAPFFPPGTVHVVVVDPGVGTVRRPILVEELGQYFVAPDNGVLSLIVAQGRSRYREITNRDLWLERPSATFHGRDLFSPVAAALGSGTVNPHEVGRTIETIEMLADLEARRVSSGDWQGRVLSVDRFGNVITNFHTAQFRSIATQPFRLSLGAQEVTQWHKTFGLAKREECFAYFGSSGYVEAGVNQGSAAHALKAAAGDTILLRV